MYSPPNSVDIIWAWRGENAAHLYLTDNQNFITNNEISPFAQFAQVSPPLKAKMGVLAHFMNKNECTIYSKKWKKGDDIFIGYTDATKANLFSDITREFNSDFVPPPSSFVNNIGPDITHVTSLRKVVQILATTLYTCEQIHRDKDASFAFEFMKKFVRRKEDSSLYRFQMVRDSILKITEPLCEVPNSPAKSSLLDLLADKFSTKSSSLPLPPIPEHFRHPTTTKKKGGKRVPRSWFMLPPPEKHRDRNDAEITAEKQKAREEKLKAWEKHRAWNAAVITELTIAIYKFRHDGNITTEKELRNNIRNTNDRLRRLEAKYDEQENDEPSEKSSEAKQKKTRGPIPHREFVAALLPPVRTKTKATQGQAASDDTTG